MSNSNSNNNNNSRPGNKASKPGDDNQLTEKQIKLEELQHLLRVKHTYVPNLDSVVFLKSIVEGKKTGIDVRAIKLLTSEMQGASHYNGSIIHTAAL